MSDEELRRWQKPLTEEAIAQLVIEFEEAKRKIEEVWGAIQPRPWIFNRRN